MNYRHSFFVFVLALAGMTVQAESLDREKPIQIYAQRFQGDEIHQVALYSGSVEVHQGTLEILGERLEVNVDAAGYRTVTITGNPVKMKEKRDEKTPGVREWVHASSLKAVYSEKTSKITFTNNAKLARSENGVVKDSTAGAVITYDLLTARSTVEGGQVGGKKTRVSTILVPRTKTGSSTPANTPTPMSTAPSLE